MDSSNQDGYQDSCCAEIPLFPVILEERGGGGLKLYYYDFLSLLSEVAAA